MTTPELTARKLSHFIPVQLLGRDEFGRQEYVCPGWGCGDTAYFDEDGTGHCPSCESLAEAVARLVAPVEPRPACMLRQVDFATDDEDGGTPTRFVTAPDDDFFEEDEPLADVLAAWDRSAATEHLTASATTED